MKFSVNLPLWLPSQKHVDMTKECLARIKEYSKDYELIIIETGSRYFADETCDLYIYEKDRHISRSTYSINHGVRNSMGEYVVHMSNDVMVEPEWLEAMEECFDIKPDCGAASLGSNESRSVKSPLIVEGQYWPLCMVKRDTYLALGLWDENIWGYWNDTDMIMRLYEAGYKQYRNMRVVINHLIEQTKDPDHDRVYGRNREYFYQKHNRSKNQVLFNQLYHGQKTVSEVLV